ncbi:MAG: PAS domain S-box protein [Syntrophales bacterium]
MKDAGADKKISDGSENARVFLDMIDSIFVLLRPDETISIINRKGCDILGCEEREVTGEKWFDIFFAAEERSRLKESFRRMVDERTYSHQYMESRVLTRNGKKRLIAWHHNAIRNEKGDMTSVLISGRDITVSRQVEEALLNNEKKYRELAELLPQYVFEANADGIVTFANIHALDTFGCNCGDLGRDVDFFKFVAPEERGRFREDIKKLAAGEVIAGVEYTALKEDGRAIPVIVYISPVFHEGRFIGMRGMAADISHRKRMEEEIKQSCEQLRSLVATLQDVREDERARAALAMHNELGQHLATMKMNLSRLAVSIPEPDSYQRKIQSLIKDIDTSVRMVRMISTGLRPPVLDDFGLEAAIEWQTDDFQRKTAITCRLRSNLGDFRPDRNISTAAFRIFQQYLTNIAQYTDASTIVINLYRADTELILQIRDNGTKPRAGEITNEISLKMMELKERALSIGGSLNIRNVHKEGTIFTLLIPLPPSWTKAGKSGLRTPSS